jgi:UBX domain-containing protein 6
LLNSLKTYLSLAEPIRPELDRDIRVYHIGANPSRNVSEFGDLGEDFYNVTVEELRREQALRNAALERLGMLRTRAMRRRDEQLELRRYNYSLIRVRFANSFVLQAIFKSSERYAAIHEFVSDYLEIGDVPFHFASQSLRRVPNMAVATLAEVGLAPSALLHFTYSPLHRGGGAGEARV